MHRDLVSGSDGGEPEPAGTHRFMDPRELPCRLRGAPVAEVGGIVVPVADTAVRRLVGLALLARERSGPGLLIPRCRSVHTFGMRFALDLTFLDHGFRPVDHVPGVPPNRVVARPGAAAVLEVPARGESFGRPALR